MVMDVSWRQLRVSMIYLLGKGATNEAGKYIFRAANVGCSCA